MARKICFDPDAWQEYLDWDKEKKVQLKIQKLIKECQRTPTEGEGKPEALIGNLSGFWSRRITGEHRLVYSFDDESVTIYSCKGHYVE